MEFTHIQYTGWPDFGAPSDTAPIITLIKDVRQLIKQSQKSEMINILVHCSAGVGRTGTLITLYRMMEELEQLVPKVEGEKSTSNLTLDIFNTVFHFRSKRMYMVSVTILQLSFKENEIYWGNNLVANVIKTPCIRINSSFQVQSPPQYKYLYASLSDYAKEVQEKCRFPEEEDMYVYPSAL